MILDIWVFITMMLDELGRIQSEGRIYGCRKSNELSPSESQ